MADKKTCDRMPAPNTAEAASLYQRLRGHLAVLKLHDAAEACPRSSAKQQPRNCR